MMAEVSRSAMPLGALLPQLDGENIRVAGLTLDSRRAAEGDLFLACPGRDDDGRRHIDEASRRGVAAVVAERRGADADMPASQTPLFYIDDLRRQLASIADRFYDYPARSLELFGVTGTNGKTSAVWFLSKMLDRLGVAAASIGTLGCRRGDETLEAEEGLTTPDVIELRRLLRRCVDSGAKAAALEMSSHGLDQGRGADLPIAAALFTSFGSDHLDYHGDSERYLQAKARLFKFATLEHAAFNLDDEAAPALAADCVAKIYFYSLGEREDSDIYPLEVSADADGAQVELRTPWGEGRLRAAPRADFMLGNLLGAVALLGDRHRLDELLEAASGLAPPPGRMQAAPNALSIEVRVDYAHTAEALTLALRQMRADCDGRLWCVFGCGGERDAEKRPAMGGVAEKLADRVIVCDDNPRRENPQAIIDAVLSGMRDPERVEVERDRGRAIEKALQQAQAGDAVLIAGRGHERRQHFADEIREFNDAECAAACLRRLEERA